MAKHEGREAGPGHGRRRQGRDLRGDARMIDREQPGAARRHAGDPDRAARGGRAVAQPAAALDPAFEPKAVVPRRLLRLGAHDEAGRALNGDHVTPPTEYAVLR